jgi:hypothetical protein
MRTPLIAFARVQLVAGAVLSVACGNANPTRPPDARPAMAQDASTQAADVTFKERFDAGVRACDALVYPDPQIGIGPATSALPEPLSAHVEQVEADRLRVTKEDGDALTFFWKGPSLLGKFAPGEAVRLSLIGNWTLLAGEHTTLAVMWSFSQDGQLTGEQVPGGPPYAFEPSCASVEEVNCSDWSFLVVTRLHRLLVSTNAGPVSIAMGETQSVDGWQLTNVWHNDVQLVRPADRLQDKPCYFEPTFISAATALRE